MPKIDGHKDWLGGVVFHWLTQEGLLQTFAKALLNGSG